MGSILLRNGFLVGPDAPYKVTDLLIEDGKIKAIGKSLAVEGVEEIDVAGKLVMPGFVNCHHHLYSALARGIPIAPGTRLDNFEMILENLWWKLDKALEEKEIYYSALVGILDSIKNGVTTIIDHHASYGMVSGSLDVMERAFLETGVRGVLCYEVSDRHGEDKAIEAIEENARFLKKVNSSSYQFKDKIQAMFGLHAAFTLSDKTLERCVLANEDFSTGFHIHLCEDLADVNYSLKNYGKRVVPRLKEHGILDKETLCVHGVHLEKEEIEILAEKRNFLAYNPMSNMNNAVGVPKILEMFAKGIRVVQGTDGYTNNLLENFKVAFLLQKIEKRNPTVFGFSEIEDYFFNNPSQLVKKFFGNNTLKEGSLGDVIVMDYYPPTPLNDLNFIGHLIFGISQRKVETVIIDGEVILKNGKFTKVDEVEIAKKSREVAENLWKKW